MTIPEERLEAIKRTREFLYMLLDPKRSPRVPTLIRKQASSCLRHYPGDYYLEKIKEKVPEHFGSFENSRE